MKKYNFLAFTREFYPNIWEEFYRYKRKNIPPAIGSKVKTLVSGYGSLGSQTLFVVSHTDTYIGLGYSVEGEGKYLCNIENWWKELKIISEPDIQSPQQEEEEENRKMIPSKMIVTKRIMENQKLVADAGTILDVVKDYERIGGVEVLRKKSGKYVCDYGSSTANKHCKPYYD